MVFSVSFHFDFLAVNSDCNGNSLREHILIINDSFFGYNATKDNCENLFLCRIMDPSKVIRCVIDNSSFVSNSFLNIKCAILFHCI